MDADEDEQRPGQRFVQLAQLVTGGEPSATRRGKGAMPYRWIVHPCVEATHQPVNLVARTVR